MPKDEMGEIIIALAVTSVKIPICSKSKYSALK